MQFIKKFQEGGATPAPEAAAPQQGGEDPTAMLMQGAQQAVQNQDCQIAIQVCQMVLEMLGGGGAPAEAGGPEAGGTPQSEPVYRRGGRLIRRIQK